MVEITTLSELTIDGKLSLGPNASSKDLFAFYGDELRQPSSLGLLPLDANLLNDGLPTLVVVSDAATDRDVEQLARNPCVEIVRCCIDQVDPVGLMKLLGERGDASLMSREEAACSKVAGGTDRGRTRSFAEYW